MSILFTTIFHVSGKYGGHSRQLELVGGLADKGDRVICLGVEPELVHQNIEFIAINRIIKKLPLIANVVNAAFSFLKNRKKIKDSTFIVFSELDVVAFQVMKPFLGRSKLIFMQRSDLIIKTSLLIACQKKTLGKLSHQARLLFLNFFYKKIIKRCDLVIVQTQGHRERILDCCRNVSIDVVVNNINPSWVIANDTGNGKCSSGNGSGSLDIYSHNSRRKRFLVIANLFYIIKGFDYLYEVLSNMDATEYQIDVIGGGRDMELIRTKFDGFPLTLCGPLKNASSKIKNYDAVLMTSPFDDCPNVLLEAMHSRVPVFLTNIEGHRNLIGSKYPLLVSNGPKGFSDKLDTFVRHGFSDDLRSSIDDSLNERIGMLTFDWVKRVRDAITFKLGN